MSAFARQIRDGFSAVMPVAPSGTASLDWIERAFGLTLYPAQRSAIFAPERYAIIEASTKSGKTVGSLIWLVAQMLQGKPGHNVWWVAPIRDQAKMVYRRLKQALPQGRYRCNETDLTITIDHRVIWFKGGDHPDSLYGEEVWAAVIDEATRCKDETWHAVRTTLTATGGPIRIIGNVKGRRNWAYQLARQAESGDPTMHYARITAAAAVAAGIMPASEIEDARAVLPASVFRELYHAEPADDEGNPFGVAAIRACMVPGLSEQPVVAWGWDLAKSRDWTVGVGLDAAGRVAQLERFQSPWEETIRRMSAVTQAPALVDSSGVGDPVVEQLQRQGDGLFEGFKFSAQSKQQLMEGLAVAIQQRGVAYPAGVLVQELESFEYVYTRTGVQYSAPAGRHDDGVCALALAVRRLTVMTDGWGFLAWANEQVAAAKAGRPTVCTRDLGHAPSSDTPPEEENPWLAALRKENGPPRRIW